MSNIQDKIRALERISFGKPTAEEEAAQLERYFVETPQWKQVRNGEADIIYGPKGSGKSAIYSLLVKRASEFSTHQIRLITAENPRGNTVFEQLSLDPPTSEHEFRALWKLYFLSLLGETLRTLPDSEDAADVVRALEEGHLLEPGSSLSAKLRAAYEYVRKLGHVESFEGGLKLDPLTGHPVGLTGKITIKEPSYENRKLGLVSVDSLLAQADAALQAAGLRVWILLDRLDNAFFEHPDLENSALRALFRVYIDFNRFVNIHLKIFLRTDIWRRITNEGFREASHISRQVTLEWNPDSLLNLLAGRILDNQEILDRYQLDKSGVLVDAKARRDLLYRIFPSQVDQGKKRPKTFEWMLNHIIDGNHILAPRELIHLVSSAREEQLKSLNLGLDEPEGELLFSPEAFRAAMPAVSEARYQRTLCAEYPRLKPFMDRLEGAKTEHSTDSLENIWSVDGAVAQQIAKDLVDIGFFEKNINLKTKEITYWIPLLYRDALKLVQGRAQEE